MAGELLMNISQDERERAIFRSRKKYQTDLESNMLTARREGRAEGRSEVRAEFARNLLKRNRPIDEIMEDTGLTRTEIEALRDTN